MASQDSLSQPSRPSSTSAAAQERLKYQSPPPPASSMTPPPSSQLPQLAPAIARTPTPTHSHLSSPPPTIRVAPQPSMLNGSAARDDDTIANATVEELRSMLSETTIAYREARASAAHHALQYNLLGMESSESMKRMGVELDMAYKEVEVLQAQAQQRDVSSLATPTMSNKLLPTGSPQDQELTNLKNRCSVLEIENDNLRRQCQDLSSTLLERETSLTEENERLRSRIRENRDHLNLLRRSSQSADGTPFSAFTTPQRNNRQDNRKSYNSTPSKTRPTDERIAQLLMAGEILSQGANTTPSTPTGARRQPANQHQRNSHSLSSLPATPIQARTAPAASRSRMTHYEQTSPTPAYKTKSQRPIATTPAQPTRRRASRDSTISASDISADDDNNTTTHAHSNITSHEKPLSASTSASRDATIYESRASQEAANMLRRRSSFRHQPANYGPVPTNTTNTAAGASSPSQPASAGKQAQTTTISQGRLYGAITKPHLQRPAEFTAVNSNSITSPAKRKRVVSPPLSSQQHSTQHTDFAPAAASPTKRGKSSSSAAQGVGLGIGGWGAVDNGTAGGGRRGGR